MSDVTSINTPGIYYAIGYVLAAVIVVAVSPKRRPIWMTMLCHCLYFLIIAPVIVVSTGERRYFIFLVLLYASLMYLDIGINTTFSWKSALFVTVRTFMMGEFLSSFEWMIYYIAVTVLKYPKGFVFEIVMLVLVHFFMGGLFFSLEKNLNKSGSELDIHMGELTASLFIALAVYIMSNISYLIGNQLFGGTYAMVIFVVRTTVDMGGLAILYAFYIQLRDMNIRLDRDRLLDDLEMQYTNYEVLEKSMEVVNIKYHDLKHQIALLKDGLSNKDEALDYLNKMEEDIKMYEAQNKTGNKVLDTILTGKSIYCQNHWIEMTCVADGEALSFMEPMDLSSLFGNLLDNAIESVDKISAKERRLIHLAVSQQKGFVRIRVENCYDKKPELKDGLIPTSKTDKRYHGYGMKSIQNTVKKYGGSVTFSASDGWFESRILIPQKQHKN